MSETKEVVEAVINTEDVVKNGELTDVDLDKVSGGTKAEFVAGVRERLTESLRDESPHAKF